MKTGQCTSWRTIVENEVDPGVLVLETLEMFDDRILVVLQDELTPSSLSILADGLQRSDVIVGHVRE